MMYIAGVCEDCFKKNMYSDVVSHTEACKPLTKYVTLFVTSFIPLVCYFLFIAVKNTLKHLRNKV